MPKTIFAHTAHDVLPPYINVTEEDNGQVAITVRRESVMVLSPTAQMIPVVGPTARMAIPHDVLSELSDALATYVRGLPK